MRNWHRGLAFLAFALALTTTVIASGNGVDKEITVGSNDNIFSQNKQNEPAIAVDANHPNVLAAGVNDNIDMEACNAGDPTTCPFSNGVGSSGIMFSFNSGETWTQPTYTGLTARNCLGPAECVPAVGPIGTLPWYYENGLVSDGDPALAFGPKPDEEGEFSWENGSRLYYANLASKLSGLKSDHTFKGFEAIAVSRTDDAATAAQGGAAGKAAWKAPVIASKQSSATFADKEQIWADNAASSPHFGNVYVCFAAFTGNGAAPMTVARSTDGGDSWSEQNVSPAHNISPTQWGQSGCTIRTSSTGVVYLFYEEFQSPFKFLPPTGKHVMQKSTNGGATWSKPRDLYTVTDPCFHIDPVIFRCVMDGVAGARNDLAASPSIDISNGAPTGTDATNEIAVAWADGRDGDNNEHVLFSYSTNGGNTWSAPAAIESDADDRGYYAAPAISPDGSDVYVVYNAFTTPYRNNTTDPRGLVGVILHADIGAGGALGAWSEVHRGAEGDSRGSSQNNLEAGFLGDYVYGIATRTYGAFVWNDARNAADCPALDAWRAFLRGGPEAPKPAIQSSCPANFGNTDIFGATITDPTP